MLARLALSAVCRLTPLEPAEVADLKLAVTEAATEFVEEDAATTRVTRRRSTSTSASTRIGWCSS